MSRNCPNFEKNTKKLQNNYNTTQSQITSLEEMLDELQEEHLELTQAMLKTEELNEALEQENKTMKELLALENRDLHEKAYRYDTMKKEYEDIKNRNKILQRECDNVKSRLKGLKV